MIKKLRSMSATVETVENITLELESGEFVDLKNATVLTSYASRVAVYCKMQVFLLPRFDYSVTTWKHLHAFVEDYCPMVRDYNAATMRQNAKERANGGEYQLAKAIVTRSNISDKIYRDLY